jgi:hypothetical protein
MAGWMGFRPGACACRFLCAAGTERPYDPALFDQSGELVRKRHRIEEGASIAHVRGFLCPSGRKDLVFAQDPRRHIGGAGRHR